MKRAKRRMVAAAVAGLGAVAGAHAQQPLPAAPKPRAGAAVTVEERWRESFDAFASLDKLAAPRPGGVLFVGSSSIRLWDDLDSAFQAASVIKRGFGGSRMLDVTRYVDRLVLPYRPRLVVVYAGDNDLAEGRTPEQVLDSYAEFVARVREQLPTTRIAYLSIKPSPLRAALMPQARRANQLIADYSAREPNLDFIDVYSRMIDNHGQPRRELYQRDALHLNADGYALWQSVIAGHLTDAAAPAAGVAARTP